MLNAWPNKFFLHPPPWLSSFLYCSSSANYLIVSLWFRPRTVSQFHSQGDDPQEPEWESEREGCVGSLGVEGCGLSNGWAVEVAGWGVDGGGVGADTGKGDEEMAGSNSSSSFSSSWFGPPKSSSSSISWMGNWSLWFFTFPKTVAPCLNAYWVSSLSSCFLASFSCVSGTSMRSKFALSFPYRS